jgi:2-hydroxyacyl-CoA lyase 1
MDELSGSEILARQLAIEHVDTVFTVYAGPMTAVLPALVRLGVRVIGCRHEEQAGFMASAWGYANKRPGVVIVGSGPAMTNTVTSLYAAEGNTWPLVVLGGSAGGSARALGPTRGLGGFQETDQVAYAAPACKWAIEVDYPERIPDFVHLGLGKAVSGRPGGVYIDFPGALLNATVPEDKVRWRRKTPETYQPSADPAGIDAIAAMLAEAERPLVLVGKGAAWSDASAPLQRLVSLGIPFVASPMGRGTIPDDDPRNAGAARSAALGGADAVLMVGGRFNWIFNFGLPPSFAEGVRLAQIDISEEEMYGAAELEAGVVADCAPAVDLLCSWLEPKRLASTQSGWLESLQDQSARHRAALDEIMDSDSIPISPYRLFRDVRDCLPRDASISVDGEITLGIGRLVLQSYLPRHRLNSGITACMGVGVPYAIGAKLARPDQPSIAVLGDYAFGASAMEVETAARVGAPVVFVIVNNGGITGRIGQNRGFRPEDPLISGLLPVHYDKLAEMVDGYAARIERPEDIRPAVEEALASGKVSVVNVLVDPEGGSRRGGGYL